MIPANLISEARAKIIWGESSSSVHNFLAENGITKLDADEAIKECVAERNLEIRKIGIRRTLVGGGLTIGAGIFFYWSHQNVDFEKMSFRGARGFVGMAILIALAGLYGFGKLVDGFKDLVRPQSEEKSISDISS
jgi:hypothetical protein